MKETDNNNDDSSSSDSVDSNATVFCGVTTKVKAKPIAVFVRQRRMDHPATLVDPTVLQQIEEKGPTGWRLTQIPDNEYIMIEWSTGARQPVISTSVVLQNEDDYGYDGTDSTSQNRRSGRTRHTSRRGSGGGGGSSGTNASTRTQSGRGTRGGGAGGGGTNAASTRTQNGRGTRGGGAGGGTNAASARTQSRRGSGTNTASASTQSGGGIRGGGGTTAAVLLVIGFPVTDKYDSNNIFD